MINTTVERFKTLEENSQIKCKSAIKSFIRTYPFVAAVTPYKSTEWEMLYTFFILLVHKLPKLKGEDFTKGLEECIDMEQVQVSKMAEHSIMLENLNTEIAPIPVGSGQGGKHEPEMAKLSDILDQFNDIHWLNVENVKQQIDSLPDKLVQDENFRQCCQKTATERPHNNRRSVRHLPSSFR